MTSKKPRCQMRQLVDDHFTGRIRPPAEQKLRQHLPECEPCRTYYERQMLLAELDPSAAPAQDRLARGLGVRPLRQPGPRGVYIAAVATVTLAAVAIGGVMLTSSGPPPAEVQFQPRGGGTVAKPGAGLHVYSVQPDQPAKRVKDSISVGEELAFAYFNAAQKKRLMVFGVDHRQKVYWYYPAWQDPTKNPAAVIIRAQPGIHELPEATRHDLGEGRLTIYGIFTDRALRVREVEALVRQGAATPEEPLVRGTLQVKQSLLVKP